MTGGIQFAVIQKRGGMTEFEFESAVIGEIYKQVKTSDMPLKMYHLRTLDGREVDLLLETESGYIAIEVKMSNHVNRPDARHLVNDKNYVLLIPSTDYPPEKKWIINSVFFIMLINYALF